MLIRIYLKSGQALPDVQCEAVKVFTDTITGAITDYKFQSPEHPYPLSVNVNEIAAVYKITDEPVGKCRQDNRVAELEQELARAMFFISAQKDCNTCKYEKRPRACCADCMECNVDGCRCRYCHEGSGWEWRGLHG